MRKNVLLLLCALLVFALVGCSATAPVDQEARQADAAGDSETLSLSGAQTPAQDEDAPLRAMILSLSDGEALLVAQDTEMPFTSPLSAEILGLDGEALSLADLSAGDIVDVYGNGVMTRSYPAQYNSVTKVQLVSEGSAEDTAQYQELLDSFGPMVSAQTEQTEPTEQAGTVNRAIAIPYGEDGILFVDANSELPFTVTLPEEIYGLGGEKITAADLERGNVVEITGNGIMLNSYPGQYPGVTKIQVVAEGSPEDADPYQEILDAYFAQPDTSEPASLQLQYRVPEAIVTASATMGSYTWEGTVPSADGEATSIIACGAHVLQWNDMLELNLDEATEVTLQFYPSAPTSVKVVRWPDSLLGTEDLAAAGEGEEVAVSAQDDAMTLTAEPGYVYAVYAEFDLGSVEYGFASSTLEK